MAVASGGGVWQSSDGGAKWNITSAPLDLAWTAAASSRGAEIQVAAADGDGIWIHKKTTGTWNPVSAPLGLKWKKLATDCTGTYLVAVATLGGIWTNAFGGTGNWSKQTTPDLAWSGVSSDASGQRVAAVARGGGIYTNHRFGTGNWTEVPGTSPNSWIDVTSSADGQEVVGLMCNGSVFVIHNATSDTPRGSLKPTRCITWTAVASDATGTQVTASKEDGSIYTNAAFGQGVWKRTGAPAGRQWAALSTDFEADHLYAAEADGGIW